MIALPHDRTTTVPSATTRLGAHHPTRSPVPAGSDLDPAERVGLRGVFVGAPSRPAGSGVSCPAIRRAGSCGPMPCRTLRSRIRQARRRRLELASAVQPPRRSPQQPPARVPASAEASVALCWTTRLRPVCGSPTTPPAISGSMRGCSGRRSQCGRLDGNAAARRGVTATARASSASPRLSSSARIRVRRARRTRARRGW